MFDLVLSQQHAQKRLGRIETPTSKRRQRSDRGRLRIDQQAVEFLQMRLLGNERPHLPSLIKETTNYCRAKNLPCPSRASIYKLLDAVDGHYYRMGELPPAVKNALYNLATDAVVPGRQVAFYCFNYGTLPAICYASGMPWLDLRQAGHLRGWRPKSRGLWEAVCRIRKI